MRQIEVVKELMCPGMEVGVKSHIMGECCCGLAADECIRVLYVNEGLLLLVFMYGIETLVWKKEKR